jgi:hypothetical protein
MRTVENPFWLQKIDTTRTHHFNLFIAGLLFISSDFKFSDTFQILDPPATHAVGKSPPRDLGFGVLARTLPPPDGFSAAHQVVRMFCWRTY